MNEKKQLTVEEKTEISKRNKISIVFLCGYYFFVAVVPIIVIAAYFDLFKKNAPYAPSGIFLIALIFIAVFAKNQFKRLLDSLDSGVLKTCVHSLFIPILLLVLLLIIMWASNAVAQLKVVLFLSLISNIIAVPFNALFTYQQEKIKEIKEVKDNEKSTQEN